MSQQTRLPISISSTQMNLCIFQQTCPICCSTSAYFSSSVSLHSTHPSSPESSPRSCLYLSSPHFMLLYTSSSLTVKTAMRCAEVHSHTHTITINLLSTVLLGNRTHLIRLHQFLQLNSHLMRLQLKHPSLQFVVLRVEQCPLDGTTLPLIDTAVLHRRQ
jgi:hypothetical protein